MSLACLQSSISRNQDGSSELVELRNLIATGPEQYGLHEDMARTKQTARKYGNGNPKTGRNTRWRNRRIPPGITIAAPFEHVRTDRTTKFEANEEFM